MPISLIDNWIGTQGPSCEERRTVQDVGEPWAIDKTWLFARQHPRAR